MSKLLPLLKTSRLPNLILLALVQWIVLYYYVQGFSLYFYLLLSSSTLLIALSGYVLNDIQDIEIDSYNKKLGLINTSNKKHAYLLAISTTILGLSLGFLACTQVGSNLFPVFILCSLSLSAYAFFLSKYKIIGNFVISLLISTAILLSYYLHTPLIAWESKDVFSLINSNLLTYAAIAFILNWIREVTKDLEDFDGDKKFNRHSLPIVLGASLSKFFIGFVLFSLLCFFAMSMYLIDNWTPSFFYNLSLLIVSGTSFYKLIKSRASSDFKNLSLLLKVLMFVGLLFPLFT